MRHSVAGYKLGRTKSSRIALRRNLIKQLFTHERIQTTKAKAAAIRGDAERLITLAKNSADADRAMFAKAAMAEAMGMEVALCGTRQNGKGW